MTRPTPDEGTVRETLRDVGDGAEEAEPQTEAEQQPAEEAPPAAGAADAPAAEDGSTDEGAGEDGGAPPDDGPSDAEKYLDLARRTQADFENFRKRAAKDIAAAAARARTGLIRELLPVVDNLERALDSAPDGDPMADGVRLVLLDLHGVLSREGVEAIEPKGETFDPNVHEALTTREEEGVDAGVVLDVVEKGYRSPDQVIRPARVVVAA